MKNLLLSFALLLAAISVFAQKTYIPDHSFRLWLQTNYASCMVGDSLITNCSNVVNATSVDVSFNSIANLTGIETFISLTSLNCYNNQLTSLDVSVNTALTYLDCGANPLTNLDVSANTALTYLYCEGNQLTSLDVSSNTALIYLLCWQNQLISLDVSVNTALTYLDCGDNQLTSLDVSTNTALTILGCGSNQLTGLDVSANNALTALHCMDNQLTSLNVKNGNNINFTEFYAYSNPNLSCIQVDDTVWATANWINIDVSASFSEDCSVIVNSVANSNSNINIYPNPTNDKFTIEFAKNGIAEIINLQGRIIKSVNLQNAITITNLQEISDGVYTIRIKTDKEIIVKKLIKQ